MSLCPTSHQLLLYRLSVTVTLKYDIHMVNYKCATRDRVAIIRYSCMIYTWWTTSMLHIGRVDRTVKHHLEFTNLMSYFLLNRTFNSSTFSFSKQWKINIRNLWYPFMCIYMDLKEMFSIKSLLSGCWSTVFISIHVYIYIYMSSKLLSIFS